MTCKTKENIFQEFNHLEMTGSKALWHNKRIPGIVSNLREIHYNQ